MSVREADPLIQNGSVVPVDPSSTALAAGWLPQDPTLFAGTVTDNIRLGWPDAPADAPAEAVAAAARDAALDDVDLERDLGPGPWPGPRPAPECPWRPQHGPPLG